jgi:FG-GAP-like repeat
VGGLGLRLPVCLGALAALVSAAHGDADPSAGGFRSHELRLPHPVRQAAFVVPTAGGAERSLVVAGVMGDGTAMLSTFAPARDGSLPAEPTRSRRLADEVLALDADREALYLLTPGAVLRWDPDTDSFRTVAAVQSIFQVRPPNELIPVRFVRDVDGDGDSDLVVPDFLGYQIFLQAADGTFTEASHLALRPIAHHQEYNKRITYRAIPLYFHDVDGDGKLDALAVRGESLLVFAANGEGHYAAPRELALGLGITESFLGDDVGDIDIDHTDRTWKRVVQVRDFDGDGVIDLFAHRVRSTGLFDKAHSLELHRGALRDGSLEFSSQPPSRVESAVIVDDPSFHDIDGDGRLDFGTWSVDFGLTTILGWLVTGTIDLEVSFYRLGADGKYPPTPTRREEVEVAFDLKSGKPSVPPAFLADVNGDGRADLILGSGSGELKVFLGTGDERLFAKTPIVTPVELPGNGRDLVSAADVNGDGKDDLLIRYGAVDGAEKAKTMKVLIAR